MKILLSAYAIDPARGSEWGKSWTWLLEHAALGQQVTCLTSCWGEGNQERVEQQAAAQGLDNVEFEFVELEGPFRGWRKPKSFAGVYVRYVLWQRVAARRALELDKTMDFDLVHHISWGSPQLATGMWRLDKPLLFGPAGGGQDAPRAFRKYFGSQWRREQIRGLVGWALRTASRDYHRLLASDKHHVLAMNPETEALVGGRNATVEPTLNVPLSAEDLPSELPQRSPSSELRLLWVGRMLPRKGLPLVLEAMSKLRDVPCRLTVLGDGQLSHQVPDWIKQHGVEDLVDYRGGVPFDEVKQAYRDHDVFLFATLRDSQACQLAEAMAYGLPVVTLDLHGGSTLVPDEAGIKVPVTTPEETAAGLANGVRTLAADPDRQRRMGEFGFRYVRDTVLPWRRKFLERYLAQFETAPQPASQPVMV